MQAHWAAAVRIQKRYGIRLGWIGVALCTLGSGPVLAQGASDELSRAYGGDQSIMLATGYSHPLRAAPVNATIVTREQIERSGANNLLELLQTISAYYLTSNDGHSTTMIVRG